MKNITQTGEKFLVECEFCHGSGVVIDIGKFHDYNKAWGDWHDKFGDKKMPGMNDELWDMDNGLRTCLCRQ